MGRGRSRTQGEGNQKYTLETRALPVGAPYLKSAGVAWSLKDGREAFAGGDFGRLLCGLTAKTTVSQSSAKVAVDYKCAQVPLTLAACRRGRRRSTSRDAFLRSAGTTKPWRLIPSGLSKLHLDKKTGGVRAR